MINNLKHRVITLQAQGVDPLSLITKLGTEVLRVAQGGIVIYATIVSVAGLYSYMSRNPQKSQEGVDLIKKAAIGVVGAFVMQSVLLYLKAQSEQVIFTAFMR